MRAARSVPIAICNPSSFREPFLSRRVILQPRSVRCSIAPDWTARIEYLYDRFNRTSGTFPSGAAVVSDFDLHTLRLGLNHFFHPGEASAPPRADGKTSPWPIAPENWNVHGQFTLIGQGYPSFRSPYQGQNSLAGTHQIRNTTSATAFIKV